MFWLLQYTPHPDGYLKRPWIIWIQGGPGVSGTAYGNYMMFGPLDMEDNPRAMTWVQSANIVYVDSPVDTGFSYVDDGIPMPTNTIEVAKDLLNFTKLFLQDHTKLKNIPLQPC